MKNNNQNTLKNTPKTQQGKLTGVTMAGLCFSTMCFNNISIAGPYNDIYAFGDSLTDTGYLNGIKFTNRVGPDYQNTQAPFEEIAIEHLASDFGLTITTSRLNGTNYAVGGNRSDQVLASVNAPGAYTASSDAISAPALSFFTNVGIGLANPDALYYINGGGNDILQSDATRIPNIGSNLVTAAEQLTNRGAQYIVISNLPDISQSPASVVQGATVQATVLATVNQTNADILTRANNSDANILVVDTFGITQEIVNNPGRFGFNTYANQLSAVCFDNATDAACGAFTVDGQITSSNPNPDLFAFEDAVHPTARAHEILGDYYSAILSAPLEITLLPRLGMDSVRQQWASTRYLQPAPIASWQAFAHVQDGGRDREHTLSTVEDFSHDYTHLVIGSQYRPSTHYGLTFSLGKSQGDQTFNTGTEIEQDSTIISIDSVYRRSQWKFETSITHADTEYDNITRRFDLGLANGSEQGRSEGSTQAFRFEVALAAMLTPNWSMTPLAGFEYQRAEADAYQEITQQSTALNFGAQTQYSRRLKLGVAGAWRCENHPVTLAGQLNWITEKANNTQELQMGLNTQAGNSATLRGFTPENQGLGLDLNVNYQVNERTSLGAGIALEDWGKLSTTVGFNAQLAL